MNLKTKELKNSRTLFLTAKLRNKIGNGKFLSDFCRKKFADF